MDDRDAYVEQACGAAERAQRLLAQPATLDAYDWGLVVTLIVEADDALLRARAYEPSITLPLLETVLDELRDVTSNFTNAIFLKASKSARRRKTSLFTVR